MLKWAKFSTNFLLFQTRRRGGGGGRMNVLHITKCYGLWPKPIRNSIPY